MKLYSYIVANDYGLAPNPFWETMTLVVCKPAIRRVVKEEDWIIGTGSKKVKTKSGNFKDLSSQLVFAMKVDEVMTMAKYDTYCKQLGSPLKNKTPQDFLFGKDWRYKVGDNIYDYTNSANGIPGIRKGVHMEEDKLIDLPGENAILSNHFYYFGSSPVPIKDSKLNRLVKKEQGHLVFDSDKSLEEMVLIEDFIKWIKESFVENKVYDNPQMAWDIDNLILEKKRCHKLKKIYNLDSSL